MSVFRKKCSGSETDSFIATCSCVGGDGELDHSLTFSLWDETYGPKDKEIHKPELYVHTGLVNHNSFWKRVWLGIKYILGIRCRYGLWGEWIGDHETVTAIRNICNRYLKMEEEQKKSVSQAQN